MLCGLAVHAASPVCKRGGVRFVRTAVMSASVASACRVTWRNMNAPPWSSSTFHGCDVATCIFQSLIIGIEPFVLALGLRKKVQAALARVERFFRGDTVNCSERRAISRQLILRQLMQACTGSAMRYKFMGGGLV